MSYIKFNERKSHFYYDNCHSFSHRHGENSNFDIHAKREKIHSRRHLFEIKCLQTAIPAHSPTWQLKHVFMKFYTHTHFARHISGFSIV